MSPKKFFSQCALYTPCPTANNQYRSMRSFPTEKRLRYEVYKSRYRYEKIFIVINSIKSTSNAPVSRWIYGHRADGTA